MLFQIYGDKAGYQLLGWLLVYLGLILTNEIARRTKKGGIFFFLALPGALTVYFIAVAVGAAMGASWALNNPTHPVHEQLVPLCQALVPPPSAASASWRSSIKWESIGKIGLVQALPRS